MNIDSLPRYSAVELGLCILSSLAIEAPKETASERMAIYLRRAVSLPTLEEERSMSHLHFNI